VFTLPSHNRLVVILISYIRIHRLRIFYNVVKLDVTVFWEEVGARKTKICIAEARYLFKYFKKWFFLKQHSTLIRRSKFSKLHCNNSLFIILNACPCVCVLVLLLCMRGLWVNVQKESSYYCWKPAGRLHRQPVISAPHTLKIPCRWHPFVPLPSAPFSSHQLCSTCSRKWISFLLSSHLFPSFNSKWQWGKWVADRGVVILFGFVHLYIAVLRLQLVGSRDSVLNVPEFPLQCLWHWYCFLRKDFLCRAHWCDNKHCWLCKIQILHLIRC